MVKVAHVRGHCVRAGDLRVPRDGGRSLPPFGAPGRVGLLAAAALIAAVVAVASRATNDERVTSPSSVPTAEAVGVSGPASTAPSPSSRPARPPIRRISPAWQELSRRYLREAVATGDPAFYDLTRRSARPCRRTGPRGPGHDGDRGRTRPLPPRLRGSALEHGQRRARAGGRGPRPAGRSSSTPASSSDSYDEAEAHLAELLPRRPGSAALSRLSYLRELHGDLEGARLAMLQAEQAASVRRGPRHHRHASSATSSWPTAT